MMTRNPHDARVTFTIPTQFLHVPVIEISGVQISSQNLGYDLVPTQPLFRKKITG